jgi:hypothetical protein
MVFRNRVGGWVGFYAGEPQPPSHRADRTDSGRLALEVSRSRRGSWALDTNCQAQEQYST